MLIISFAVIITFLRENWCNHNSSLSDELKVAMKRSVSLFCSAQLHVSFNNKEPGRDLSGILIGICSAECVLH